MRLAQLSTTAESYGSSPRGVVGPLRSFRPSKRHSALFETPPRGSSQQLDDRSSRRRSLVHPTLDNRSPTHCSPRRQTTATNGLTHRTGAAQERTGGEPRADSDARPGATQKRTRTRGATSAQIQTVLKYRTVAIQQFGNGATVQRCNGATVQRCEYARHHRS